MPFLAGSRTELVLGLADRRRSSLVGKLFRPTVALGAPLIHGVFCNRGSVDRAVKLGSTMPLILLFLGLSHKFVRFIFQSTIPSRCLPISRLVRQTVLCRISS
jgi:hypothetical protein